VIVRFITAESTNNFGGVSIGSANMMEV
jgi:hypothetical protein